MAVFSRYAEVVKPTGEPMSVRSAVALINQVLDEVLTEQDGEFDADTRFAIKWFEQYPFDEAGYDPAERLARAMNVSVKGLEYAGILVARAAMVRRPGGVKEAARDLAYRPYSICERRGQELGQ
jgi:putative DNA methylase